MRRFTVVLAALLMAGACSDEDGGDSNPTPMESDDKGMPDAGEEDAMEPEPDAPEGEPEPEPCSPTECVEGSIFDVEACECVAEDLEAMGEDFECLTDWDKVRRFRITNPLGHLDEALAVANNPEGGVYPVGTIIQLIPTEAMVKRRAGFSEESADWEFFSLRPSPDGTEILDRGTTAVTNSFGGNCFDCHAKAEAKFDFICEQDHGCDPIPVGEAIINNLQENDPRCR